MGIVWPTPGLKHCMVWRFGNVFLGSLELYEMELTHIREYSLPWKKNSLKAVAFRCYE